MMIVKIYDSYWETTRMFYVKKVEEKNGLIILYDDNGFTKEFNAERYEIC